MVGSMGDCCIGGVGPCVGLLGIGFDVGVCTWVAICVVVGG